MSVTSVILCVIFIVVLPFMCGAYPAQVYAGRKQGMQPVRMYVFGFLILFASFEFLCVPFIVRLGKFSDFCMVYDIAVWFLALLSVIFAVIHRKKNKIEKLVREKTSGAQKAGAIFMWLMIAVLIFAQMVFLYFYQHLNGDDSYYVAQSVLTEYHDTMFQRDSYTGAVLGLDARHALSAMPVFITWLAKMCRVHPTVMCHSILAPVLFALMYGVYILIAQKLFDKKKAYVPVFILLLNIWYIWGNVSLYTAETFAYTRTWQGKSIFANIIIPLAFCFLLDVVREKKRMAYPMLFVLAVSGVLVTTASVYLLSMLYVITGIWSLIIKRNKKPLMNLILCCIPSLVYGAVYCYLLYKW